MSALEVPPFHGIALCKSIDICLLAYLLKFPIFVVQL